MKLLFSLTRHSVFAYVVAGFLFLMSGISSGQRGVGGARTSPLFPDVEKETMIFEIPEKWYPYSRRTDAKIDTFFSIGDEP
jgi:hypothetical protein